MKLHNILLVAIISIPQMVVAQAPISEPSEKKFPTSLDVGIADTKKGDYESAQKALKLARANALLKLEQPPKLENDAYIALYASFDLAKKMEENGKIKEALELYETVLIDFRKFQSLAQHWEPQMVKNRIDTIEKSIKKLK
jgi:hypothetical protein